MKITVVGAGFVGMANSCLLAQHNEVVLLDVDREKVEMINDGISPIEDSMIGDFLQEELLDLMATTDPKFAYDEADYVVIAVPTDYDPVKNYFNTTLIEKVLAQVKIFAPNCTVVIKSTIPVGYCKSVSEEMGMDNIIFSPEFLREGTALQDNLYPDRIIVGEKSKRGEIFADLLEIGAKKEDISVVLMDTTEAEAVKLFANGYLANRVAYFNELDSYAEAMGLNSRDIITGVGLDHRIGSHYNNPSFGFGGYCFPKDTQQLSANFNAAGVKSALVHAVPESNNLRKLHIAWEIMQQSRGPIGIYKLSMKSGSDNYRSSAILGVIELMSMEREVIIFEESIKENEFMGCKIINDLEEFKGSCDIIVANRMEQALQGSKIYTRDVFNSDL